VDVPVFDPLLIDATDDIVEQCPFVPHDLNVEATGGSGSYTFRWLDPDGNVESTSNGVHVSVPETSTYTVIVEDQCGERDTTTVTITVLSPPLELSITPKQQICPGDSVLLTVTATGGFGNYHYNWTHSGDTTASVWVKPTQNTRYFVIVKDDCQTFQVSISTSVTVVQPNADFNPITDPKFTDLPITFHNLSSNGNSYQWDLGDGTTSTMVHPNNTYDTPGTYNITLITTDRYGCVDSITKPITILDEAYLYIPNTFTPDGNKFNETFKPIFTSGFDPQEYKLQIYNRWGELIFESFDPDSAWDGTYGGMGIVKGGTYIWKIQARDAENDNKYEFKGFVNVLK
jgi:gliding motility-associated-like protein